MEIQSKPVDFSNHIAFVDLEANMVTNPVFGRISDSVKPATGQRSCGGKTAPKRAWKYQFTDANRRMRDRALVIIENRVCSLARYKYRKKRWCLYCNSNRALEDCLSLWGNPYQKLI